MTARLLLLHGYLGCGRSWQRVVRELDGAEPIAPDLLGHGDVAREPGPYALEKIVEQVRRELPGMGPTHIVGHSMGALVALALAGALPGIQSVGLVGLPVFGSREDGYRHQAGRSWVHRLLMTVHHRSHPGCVAVAATARAWLPLASRLAPEYPAEVLPALFRHSPSCHAGALDNVVFAGLGPVLAGRPGLPRIVALHGSADAIAPVDPAARLARSAGWGFDTMHKAGHHLIYTHAGQVARWIERRVLRGDSGEEAQLRLASRRAGDFSRSPAPRS